MKSFLFVICKNDFPIEVMSENAREYDAQNRIDYLNNLKEVGNYYHWHRCAVYLISDRMVK